MDVGEEGKGAGRRSQGDVGRKWGPEAVGTFDEIDRLHFPILGR